MDLLPSIAAVVNAHVLAVSLDASYTQIGDNVGENVVGVIVDAGGVWI